MKLRGMNVTITFSSSRLRTKLGTLLRGSSQGARPGGRGRSEKVILKIEVRKPGKGEFFKDAPRP